jgi:hypothetical protein
MIVRLDRDSLIDEFTKLILEYPPIVKLTDNVGSINIPAERFNDFAHDIGFLLGTIIENCAAVDDEE